VVKKSTEEHSISECEASPHTFDAVHEMAALRAQTPLTNVKEFK
jgi:hypothetical protein